MMNWRIRGSCLIIVAATLLAFAASAQQFYIGVKGGTPLSDSRLNTVFAGRTGSGAYRLYVRRYTVGPTVEFGLPIFGLAVEVDALYKRLDTQAHSFMNPVFGSITRSSRNSWEFPMLLRRAWVMRRLAPFASAGGIFRIVPAADYSVETFTGSPGQPNGTVQRFRGDDGFVQGGWTLGGGVRLQGFARLSITPELRYTRYTSPRQLPTQNQFEFLLGLGFTHR
jgi:hypothetical protein